MWILLERTFLCCSLLMLDFCDFSWYWISRCLWVHVCSAVLFCVANDHRNRNHETSQRRLVIFAGKNLGQNMTRRLGAIFGNKSAHGPSNFGNNSRL
jgi:hypothetical protein